MTTQQRPVSSAAKKKALQLHSFVFDSQEPTVWTAQHMTAHECLVSLLTIAGQFHQNEALPEDVLGALLMACAWIAKHGEPSREKLN